MVSRDTYSAQKAAKTKNALKPMALSNGGVNCAMTKFPIQFVIVVSPMAKERPLVFGLVRVTHVLSGGCFGAASGTRTHLMGKISPQNTQATGPQP